MSYLTQRESTKSPSTRAPRGACDCHAHIFGDPAHYSFVQERSYTPPQASVMQYRGMLDQLGIDRAVIVQPSVYGTDNSCTLDAVAQLGLSSTRAVLTLDAAVTDAELEDYHRRGARGVRFNTISTGRAPLEQLEQIAGRISPFGWHIQTYVPPAILRELRPTIQRLPVPLVIDHMGQLPADATMNHPDVKLVLDLLENGNTWVKLTPYRISIAGHPYTDTLELARAMLHRAPERCIWGSDWPHPALTDYMPDDGDLFDLLCSLVTNPEQLHKVLVSNPARLYGFDP